MNTPVDVRSVRRRMLAFSSQADVARDLDALEAAHGSGRLERLGNHDAGAIFDHLAMAMRCSVDGFPVRAALFLRVIGPLVKKSVLSKPIQPGVRLSQSDERAAWNTSVTFEQGIASLREQITRAAQPGVQANAAHPFFGRMTPEEWRIYHLRHRELHLSFLRARPE